MFRWVWPRQGTKCLSQPDSGFNPNPDVDPDQVGLAKKGRKSSVATLRISQPRRLWSDKNICAVDLTPGVIKATGFSKFAVAMARLVSRMAAQWNAVVRGTFVRTPLCEGRQ